MVERLVAVVVLAAALVYLVSAWALPLGTAARPAAGFYPLAVGLFGAVVIAAWVATAGRRRTADTVAMDGGRRVAATGALLMGFCLALPWTGYPAAALLFTGLLLKSLGSGWAAALLIGVASALVSYYCFGTLLGVPLPRGVLLD